MATEDPRKKPNSFSDIPQPGAVVVPTGLGAPVIAPASAAPLGMLTANMAPQPTPEQAANLQPARIGMPAAVGAAPPVGNPAQFLNTPGAGRGMVTPAAAVPAAGPVQVDPMMEAIKTPFRAAARGVQALYAPMPGGMGDPGAVDALGNVVVPPAAAAGMGSAMAPSAVSAAPSAVAPAAAAVPGSVNPAVTPSGATQAQVRAVDNRPANAAAIAAAPTAVTAAVPTASTGLGRPNLGTMEDANSQAAAIRANTVHGANAAAGIIDGVGADARQKFFDEANLRNVAARTTTTRRGTTVNEGELAAAMAPINARARLGEATTAAQSAQTIAAMREAGETGRTTTREAGAQARAAVADTRAQQSLDLQRQEFGLRATGAQMDNASKARLEAAQNEFASAKTPEAKRAAQEKIQVLSGRGQADAFQAVTVGGGSAVDPVTGLAVAQPQRALVFNKATGETREVGGAPGAAPKAPAGMKVVGTANGKPVYEDANGKRFQ